MLISFSMRPHPHFQEKRRWRRDRRSSALVITLVVLVLISLLVVSLMGMVGAERATTHGGFENERARQLANLAVDEVVATLRDNIPTNNLWAAGPGRLCFYTNQANYTIINLFSGLANGSVTGTVDLNAPILGGSAPVTYSIVPTNNVEYTSTLYPKGVTMPVAWINILQDGTLVRGTGSDTSTRDNPVVGRYAYWVDTETSKDNLNTSGYDNTAAGGQTSYNLTNPTTMTAATTPIQNLTGSPSRVDLAQLDFGGANEQTLALATYHYTYGGAYAGDALGTLSATPSLSANPNLGGGPSDTVAEGMQRFNTIYDWAQLTKDSFSGASVTPITNSLIELNKFYLTTKSRTPEVNPWGYNKLWWQKYAPALATSGTGAGNRPNGKGIPIYPTAYSVPPPSGDVGAYENYSDKRFYCYPFNSTLAASVAGFTPSTPDMQWMAPYDLSSQPTTAGPTQFTYLTFVQNMMKLMARRDWPGMPNVSFIDKYGQAECEDLAWDMLCLDDSALGGRGSQGFYGFIGGTAKDQHGYYGDHLLYYTGTNVYSGSPEPPRLLGSVVEAPYINEVAVSFTPTASGYTASPTASPNPNVLLQTNSAAMGPNSGPMWTTAGGYTKDGTRPGFVPPIGSGGLNAGNYMNVAMTPSIQLYYPPGFKDYWTVNNGSAGGSGQAGLVDVLVTATGTYNSQPVIYGGTNSMNGDGTQYYWGFLDSPTTGLSYSPPLNGLHFTSGMTQTLSASPIYIGPFDKGSSPAISIQFRSYASAGGPSTAYFTYEIVPMGQNYATAGSPAVPTSSLGFTQLPGTGGVTPGAPPATSATEKQGWNNVLNSPSTPADVTLQNSDGSYKTNYVSPTFAFKVNITDATGNHPALALSGEGTPVVAECYEVTDLRVYRYVSDWVLNTSPGTASGITPGLPPSYVKSYPDPLTGITGDDSKLAWPIVTPANFNNFTPNSDPRLEQLANNITSFPGVGWLSVLPLNIESSQGPPATDGSGHGGSGDPGTKTPPFKPIPWRTLSLLPATNANQLPDWLLLDCFAVAYDQTFCSQTDGKLNVNTGVYPFGLSRNAPLATLLCPKSYAASYSAATPSDLTSITIAQARTLAGTLASNSISSTYVVGPGSSLPPDIYMYTGQICQEGKLANPSGGPGQTQFQMESLARTLAGTLTTRSSDFKVHVIAQSVKQIFVGTTSTLLVTGEQRMRALVSRETDVGPDNLPNTPDDPQLPADPSVAEIGRTNAAAAAAAFTTADTGNGASRPPFKFVVSNVEYINN